MSSNKSIRQKMEKKYGKKCMIEEAGIRKIPVEERRKIKGYKRTQEQITYHHIIERCKGGPRTEENGALLKEYNHTWLHSLSKNKRNEVNEALQKYKLNFVTMQVVKDKVELKEPTELSFDLTKNCIELPLYDIKEKKKTFNRAKVKEETRKMINEELDFIE